MTSGDAPADWTEDDLAEFHRIVLWALLRHVSPPPGAEEAGAGRPVRGMLRPPGRPEYTRVVLWDGHDPGTSVAYDLPLLDPYGTNVPWSAIAGILRQLAAGPAAAELAAAAPVTRDGLGIPVVDARAAASRFQDEPSYDLSDAAPQRRLHARALRVAARAGTGTAAHRFRAARSRHGAPVRGPARRPAPPDRPGHRAAGRRGPRTGGVHRDDGGVALPRTGRARMEHLRGRRPYCAAVYDFTHW